MVEGFFSKLTKQMLNGIKVSDKEELESRIYQYFDEINKVPVPYHWPYRLDDINLAREDIRQIVYEVVNHKAANARDKDKRAPLSPEQGNGMDKTIKGNKTQFYLNLIILVIKLLMIPRHIST